MAQAANGNVAARVFEFLDNNETTAAERILAPALSRQPRDRSLRAANALLSLKLGRTNSARRQAIELDAEQPSEDDVINVITHILQNTCGFAALAACYERLVPLFATAPAAIVPILENLAGTYLRLQRFTELQKTATALYQRVPTEKKYLYWSAMANFINANVTKRLAEVAGQPLPPASLLMYKIAARTLNEKILVAGSEELFTPQVAGLYVDCLAALQLEDDIISFLVSERGASVGVLKDRLSRLLHSYRRRGMAPSANAVALHLWRLDPDCFDFATQFFDTYGGAEGHSDHHGSHAAVAASHHNHHDGHATVAIDIAGSNVNGVKTAPTKLELTYARSYDEAHSIVATVFDAQRSAATEKRCRGAMMALLELLWRRRDFDELERRCVVYAAAFRGKPVAFLDLIKYALACFHHDVVDRPISRTTHMTCTSATSSTVHVDGRAVTTFDLVQKLFPFPTSLGSATRDQLVGVCHGIALEGALRFSRDGAAAAQRESGADAAEDRSEVEAKALIRLAVDVWEAFSRMPVASSDLKDQEESPADLALLVACSWAAQRLTRAATAERQVQWAQWGYSIATLSSRRLYHPGLCLFAVGFAARLRAVDGAAMDALSIRAVQRDTLPQFGLWPAIAARDVAKARFAAQSGIAWYNMSLRESGSVLGKCLNFGTPSKIEDVISFTDKIQRSIVRMETFVAAVSLNAGSFHTVDELVDYILDKWASPVSESFGRLAMDIAPPAAPSSINAGMTDNIDRYDIWGPYLHMMPHSEDFKLCADTLQATEFLRAVGSKRAQHATWLAAGVLTFVDAYAVSTKRRKSNAGAGRKKSKNAAESAAEADESEREVQQRQVFYDNAAVREFVRRVAGSSNNEGVPPADRSRLGVVLAKITDVVVFVCNNSNNNSAATVPADLIDAVAVALENATSMPPEASSEEDWPLYAPLLCVALRLLDIPDAVGWAARVASIVRQFTSLPLPLGVAAVDDDPRLLNGAAAILKIRQDADKQFVEFRDELVRDLGVVARRKQ